jgi:hypothetical protein
MIQKYQEASDAVTVQAAILNAISLALDYADELDREMASEDDRAGHCNPRHDEKRKNQG